MARPGRPRPPTTRFGSSASRKRRSGAPRCSPGGAPFSQAIKRPVSAPDAFEQALEPGGGRWPTTARERGQAARVPRGRRRPGPHSTRIGRLTEPDHRHPRQHPFAKSPDQVPTRSLRGALGRRPRSGIDHRGALPPGVAGGKTIAITRGEREQRHAQGARRSAADAFDRTLVPHRQCRNSRLGAPDALLDGPGTP